MKVLSNVSDKNMVYQGKVIPPKGQILLDDKGKIIDEITDNSADIEKLRKEIKEDNTKKSKSDETRFEELEAMFDKKLENLINDMPKFEFDKEKSSLNIVNKE